MELIVPAASSWNERAALRLIQTGAVAVVLAVSTFNAFELDRFFVPKELALHLTVALAGFLMLGALRRLSVTPTDFLLAAYLLLSLLSAVMATNRRLAIRALAVSASGALLFWIARRLRATVLLALVFLSLAASGWRQLVGAIDYDGGLIAAALLGTVSGAVITGAFDAVLLLPLPSFLVWAALGALWTPAPSARSLPMIFIVPVIALTVIGTARSVMQLVSMDIYATHSDRASLARAAQIDPGNYRLRLRLARSGGRTRCEHARAAHALFPSAQAAAEAARGCGE